MKRLVVRYYIAIRPWPLENKPMHSSLGFSDSLLVFIDSLGWRKTSPRSWTHHLASPKKNKKDCKFCNFEWNLYLHVKGILIYSLILIYVLFSRLSFLPTWSRFSKRNGGTQNCYNWLKSKMSMWLTQSYANLLFHCTRTALLSQVTTLY